MTKGNDGFEIYDGFQPLNGELVFDKNVNSAFKDTELLEYLSEGRKYDYYCGKFAASTIAATILVAVATYSLMLIQKFADCLYLGKDKSSFRCLKVLGHD